MEGHIALGMLTSKSHWRDYCLKVGECSFYVLISITTYMKGHGNFTFYYFVFGLQVKDLPAYLAVCSNSSGATPKDLFEDVIEELEKQVKQYQYFICLYYRTAC